MEKAEPGNAPIRLEFENKLSVIYEKALERVKTRLKQDWKNYRGLNQQSCCSWYEVKRRQKEQEKENRRQIRKLEEESKKT